MSGAKPSRTKGMAALAALLEVRSLEKEEAEKRLTHALEVLKRADLDECTARERLAQLESDLVSARSAVKRASTVGWAQAIENRISAVEYDLEQARLGLEKARQSREDALKAAEMARVEVQDKVAQLKGLEKHMRRLAREEMKREDSRLEAEIEDLLYNRRP